MGELQLMPDHCQPAGWHSVMPDTAQPAFQSDIEFRPGLCEAKNYTCEGRKAKGTRLCQGHLNQAAKEAASQ